ncbi:MAG: tRNA(His) guanylyltransferase Thg1 family protein, partial [Victivallaceae bacterium]|nr:tRNA(His) guanylyltransferase Thg1 family protein [Victivallaceae bacterium]
MKKTTLGCRMKKFEGCYDLRIAPRFPVIVRIDGRAFHAWTKKTHCERPFDEKLMRLMAETTKFLCENVDGCVFGYTQSDEISLLLRDDQSYDSTPWFDKRVQKIVSVSASIATSYFTENNPFGKKIPAFFDARVFALPPQEVRGYFIWRQNDASKNSLSMLAQSLYPHTELVGKKRDQLQELCFCKGFNWNDLPTPKKRGYAVRRRPVPV